MVGIGYCPLQSERLWESSCLESVARGLAEGCCQVFVDQDVGLLV